MFSNIEGIFSWVDSLTIRCNRRKVVDAIINTVLWVIWRYRNNKIFGDEARKTSNVIELLDWLSAIGVKKVCLYDREGVLKKSKDVFVERFGSAELPKVSCSITSSYHIMH
ncbi:Di-trans-poly-cis-decaprenylcistransferase-like protein [Artemisia annua]|uniref:ditrans,polycis-polyprenyl diphosphate synthase [(2E,6E)-farnesyldiphosphate specific] n=1 Tax=Artemisia annua TaxID=35608 RepID=A0A2U1NV91_ARTAN|nr:Di-trans-poly-cis-decaprenylcistransferase-like protein [Artemisia annua]